MLTRAFEFSLRNRLLVMLLAALAIGIGIYSIRFLPIDAVPDVTPNQVQILTNAPGLGPIEVEQLITAPVEAAMSGLPGIERILSISRFGLSAVTVYFDEKMDVYFARRLVMERLQEAREAIPQGLGHPEMGPISTGLGEVYQFEVKGEGYSLMDVRSILEWDIALKLKAVPGVVEVNAYGGELKTYEVQLDASKLVAYDLAIAQVFEAVERNNANAGGAYIQHAQEQYLIRGEGLVHSLEDIGNIVVASRNDGTPIFVRDLGRVAFAPMVRQGAATRDGRGEAVTGVVMMLIGGNSRAVVNRVKERIEEIRRSLPPGVTIETYYDRTELVRRTIWTVSENLIGGALLVIVALLVALGDLRAGLIVASTIPLSMLIALVAMVGAGISANLMSLGSIDFGLIVDGSAVMVENIIRHIGEWRRRTGEVAPISDQQMTTIVRDAGREILRPTFFSVAIIILVYLPILGLQDVEGKMFRPVALTVVFALTASLLLTFTLVPVLASFALRRGANAEETWMMRRAGRLYGPLIARAIATPIIGVGSAVFIFAGSVAVALSMGAEFIPRLDEGAIAVQAWRLPSVSLEESIRATTMIEKVLKRFPEVVTVVSRTGRAEIATDPMGVETSDIYVILKPRDEWQTASSRESLLDAFNAALMHSVPGNVFSYSQPIELRVQELIAGVRSDLAVTIYGDDLERLKDLGDRTARIVSQVPGAADVKAEQVAGAPYLRIIIDRGAIARYGINASQILVAVQTMGGRSLGEVFEGQRRFALQARYRAEDRSDVERIKEVRIADPSGRLIPLSQLAEIRVEEGPAQISRENLHRRLAVEANVRGRDLASFVADARRAVEAKVELPPGYWIEWGGQFKNFERALARLGILLPAALVLILILLYVAFNAVTPALLIYLNVPLAASGGIFALAIRGMPFSISAGVGFIAVFGIAVLNGVVLMSYILQLRGDGLAAEGAALRGAQDRLRLVLVTALVASLGFLPMALSTSAGAEVQRPLATVVIGGLITSTALTLLVLPALYVWVERRRKGSTT